MYKKHPRVPDAALGRDGGGTSADSAAAAAAAHQEEGKAGDEGDDPDQAAPPRERARSHVPPPLGDGGDDEEGVDFVSRLPDAVLGVIISLLPTKEGSKTTTLSQRWRPVWRTAPLNLDAGDLAPDGEALAALVDRILLAHEGAGRRFCIPAQHLHDRPDMVEGWLRSPALNNLEELEFTVLEGPCYKGRLLPPPPSIFHFSDTLRVVAISQCRVPDCTDLMLQFPKLKLLSFQQVKISENSLHSIMAGCPALEGLLLRRCYGFRCLRINSPTIRSVAFHSPCCGGHCDGEGIKYGDETNRWRRKYRKNIKSFNICLKTIVLDDYRGSNPQIQFATFFIQNTPKLENMIFTGGPNNGNAYFIAQQPKLLEFEKRASETARFHFRPKQCYYDWVHIKDVHDLSLADPFECSC
uniref:Uncharacterized protein n=1 Tax=Oryza punctata TaxID=4537 RepID=A0A0E0LJA7_ORYPU